MNFLKSIDTITTKLLILVLCCITIPLVVVGNFSTNIINQSLIDRSQEKLEISKKIFLKEQAKNKDLKEIASYVKDITGAEISIYKQNDVKQNAFKENYLNINFPIVNNYNEPYSIFIRISNDDFTGPIGKNVQLVSIIAIISLVVAIVIAALFARNLTDPILELAQAAESINLGDLDYKVKITGNDETAQLAQSFNKMVSNLEKEERLRNNFVATLTHDLKVPMLAENQTVSYLLKETYGPLTSEQKEVLELIKSTNTSSLEMIGTLLEIYRYDSGNAVLFETEFDFVDLMNESVNQIKSLSMDKKIDININSNQDNILIKADKRDLKRVIHNLVSNAIYHGIYRGFINCNIEVINGNIMYEPQDKTECYTTLRKPLNISRSLLISIEDNGVGIAREDMPHLFKRFSLSKGRKPSGSGLGLYYSQQVIRMHNGHIWAESSEKGGTSFKFTIPVKN